MYEKYLAAHQSDSELHVVKQMIIMYHGIALSLLILYVIIIELYLAIRMDKFKDMKCQCSTIIKFKSITIGGLLMVALTVACFTLLTKAIGHNLDGFIFPVISLFFQLLYVLKAYSFISAKLAAIKHKFLCSFDNQIDTTNDPFDETCNEFGIYIGGSAINHEQRLSNRNDFKTKNNGPISIQPFNNQSETVFAELNTKFDDDGGGPAFSNNRIMQVSGIQSLELLDIETVSENSNIMNREKYDQRIVLKPIEEYEEDKFSAYNKFNFDRTDLECYIRQIHGFQINDEDKPYGLTTVVID